MGYDLHIVRTKDWLDADQNPIGKDEVVKLIANDNELQCVEADFQETINSKTGDVIRVKTPGYLYIKWNGVVRFWWNTREIVCKNPERNELMRFALLQP